MKKMRRFDRLMTDEEAIELLKTGEYGILATVDSENQPFGTPLSYVYYDGNIYFHSAKEGTKLDNIKNNSKVCFTVVGKTEVLPKDFSTNYESIMAFGKATLVEDSEKGAILMEIVKKYSPGFISEGEAYKNSDMHKTKVVKIQIDIFTGKHRL